MPNSVLNVDRSVRGLRWHYRANDEAEIQALEQQAGLDNLTARLLAGRGIGPDEADTFLEPSLRTQLPNPSIMQDMDKAAELIVDAVQAGQNITVFADYDVDGGTSAAQLVRWARAFGRDLNVYVPDRVAEGYGPSVDAFQKLKEQGAELVITVDCGAAANEALEAAVDIGLPIVVIDHHQMHGPKPPAAALVNPNRDDDTSGLGHLAAAGVVFMLLVALNREAKSRGMNTAPNLLDLLGLAALGTFCDVVPLIGLNRAITAQGLKVLSQRKTPGIAALADVAGGAEVFTSYDCGFVLGPRINAGGRIGRADMGAELLSTENAQLAYAHAAELDRVNAKRRELQASMLEEATDKAAKLPADAPMIIVSMDGWHPGIIGIVAGRLKDQYDKPAIVIGINDAGVGKGSGRSIKGVDLGGGITAAKEAGLLSSGGGHAMAGGLTIDGGKVADFTAFISNHLKTDIETARENLSLKIDALLSPSAMNLALIDTLGHVAPFGAGNPRPLFAMPDVRVAFAKRLKGGHVRCSLESAAGARIDAICFRADDSGLAEVLLAAQDKRYHFCGRVKRNEWNGRVKVDFEITDVAIPEE